MSEPTVAKRTTSMMMTPQLKATSPAPATSSASSVAMGAGAAALASISAATSLLSMQSSQAMEQLPLRSTTASVEKQRTGSLQTHGILQSMWIGATAGMGGIIAVYPIDVIKTRMQTSATSTSAVQILQHTIRKEGVRSFYKGLAPQLMGTMPDKAVSLATREFVKGKFSDPNCFVASLASASCSGVMQSIVMNPVEIVKVRMQVDSSLTIPGVVREMGIRGIYRGYSACISRDVMFASSYFTLYDMTKRQMNIETGCSLGYSLIAASIAGVPAALLSTPLDVVKTRMQSRGVKRMGFRDTIRQLHSEGGTAAFFSGWGPRVARIAPQFGIVLMSYDWLTHRFASPSSP